MADRCRLRAVTPADLPTIVAIERQVFADPWSLASFRPLLSGLALAAEQDEAVVAYLFARSVADEAEILNLAVRPSERRRGIARRLVETACTALAERGARTVYLEVRASNTGARAFYATLGFQEIARRQGYYRRPREDALVLARPLRCADGAGGPQRG